jgi:N-6 DNA Methylase
VHRPAHPGSLARWADDLARVAAGEGLAPAEVLAGLAAAMGVGWSGPGRAVDPPAPVPADASVWPWALDAARQALLATSDPAARRRLGAHHTPPHVARRLASIALERVPAEGPIVDPSCGGGAFLLAAGDVLVQEGGADRADLVAGGRLRGADLDPVAVATARAALEAWAGVPPPADAVVIHDGLAEGWCAPASASAVVGNPPFLSPLTDGAPTGGIAAYTDFSARFLLAAVRLARPGARVVLIQPESVLAARDAAPVRDAVLRAGALEGVWVATEPVFEAAVRVCAPVVRVGGDQPAAVRRWRGADVRPVGAVRVDVTSLPTWAPLRPTDVPRSPRTKGRVGDMATATAGFRDEFYALAAAADEAVAGDARPRLVTSGLVDPGRLRWGERRARIGGRTYDAPVVDLDALDRRVRAWVAARLVPKALVATQTRVLEAVADPDGRYVPVTPVIAVVPDDPARLHQLLAALVGPAATAWAVRHYGGTALASDAVKLSAGQVLDTPLPADPEAWDEATAAVAAGDVEAAAALLCRRHPRLLSWWRSRLDVTAGMV